MRRSQKLGFTGPRSDSRLPRWTWVTILAGGLLAYAAVGWMLMGAVHFNAGVADLLAPLTGGVRNGAEPVSPFVLLLIPAFLGGMWTRGGLRIVFKGVRSGQSRATIARDVAIFVVSLLVLILVALTTSSRPRDPF